MCGQGKSWRPTLRVRCTASIFCGRSAGHVLFLMSSAPREESSPESSEDRLAPGHRHLVKYLEVLWKTTPVLNPRVVVIRCPLSWLFPPSLGQSTRHPQFKGERFIWAHIWVHSQASAQAGCPGRGAWGRRAAHSMGDRRWKARSGEPGREMSLSCHTVTSVTGASLPTPSQLSSM